MSSLRRESASPPNDTLPPSLKFPSPDSAMKRKPTGFRFDDPILEVPVEEKVTGSRKTTALDDPRKRQASLLSRRQEEMLRPIRLSTRTSPADGDKVVKDYQGFNVNTPSSKTRLLRSISFSQEFNNTHLLIGLVGLPARGKSYIAKKILNFSLWRGHAVRVFNVGAYRRKLFESDNSSNFFDADDPKMKELRENLAQQVLQEAIKWLSTEGQIAIFDATNTTKARRALLKEQCETANIRLLIIESICDEKEVLTSNLLTKIAKSPDYVDMDRDIALKDLETRIEMYMKKYETVEDSEDLSYVKLINLQSKIVCYHIRGYYPRLLVFFLSNLRVNRRPIWLTRAADTIETSPNASATDLSAMEEHRSRNSRLSDRGIEYAKRLASFLESHKPQGEQKWDSPVFDQGDFIVWTSTLTRAIETAQFIPNKSYQWVALNMLDMGQFDGHNMEYIKQSEPEIYRAFRADMKGYRFPGGESYNDVIERVEPLMMDLESQLKPVLIISHLSCLRVLYAYFCGNTLETLPETPFPKHEVIEFTPTQYGWQEKRYNLMEDKDDQ